MALFRVISYVGGFSALGYGALKFTELNEDKLKKELLEFSEPVTEAEKKRKLICIPVLYNY